MNMWVNIKHQKYELLVFTNNKQTNCVIKLPFQKNTTNILIGFKSNNAFKKKIIVQVINCNYMKTKHFS